MSTADTLSMAARRSLVRHRSMPRVGYIGWAGHGNLGDDAVFEAAQGLLPGADLVPYEHPRRERHLGRVGLSGRGYFSTVVLGGGTVIMPLQYPTLARTALAQGLPVWALGSGVGSCGFETAAHVDIREWKGLLRQFAGVGVRGPRSKAALDELGVSGVEVVGDLALSLALPHVAEPSLPPRFAVNLALPPGEQYDAGEFAVLKGLEEAAHRLIVRGWTAVPIAMHPRDVAPTQALMERLGGGRAHLPRTTAEFFGLVDGCSFTVAVRLHTAVLSCCAGVPPLMLGYRDKCLDFMESLALEEWYVDLYHAQPGDLHDKVLALSEEFMMLRSDVLGRAQSWQRRLEQYAQRLSSETMARR